MPQLLRKVGLTDSGATISMHETACDALNTVNPIRGFQLKKSTTVNTEKFVVLFDDSQFRIIVLRCRLFCFSV
jgi:hypothetical protein